MIRSRVRDLLQQIADGAIEPDAALDRLALAPVESLPFATIDHHRALRQGFPEVIFGEGKTPEQIVELASCIAARGDGVLATRVADSAAERVLDALPERRTTRWAARSTWRVANRHRLGAARC